MKKKLIYLFIIFFGFNSSLLIGQKELTLEDAVLKRWTSLYPERLKALNWNNVTDNFSYLKSDSLLYILDSTNQLQDSIALIDLNISLEGEEVLSKIPKLTWLSSHTILYMNDNKYYSYNTKRPRKSNFLFKLEEKGICSLFLSLKT